MVEALEEAHLPPATEMLAIDKAQQLTYSRLPHRTRAAAGLLQAAFLQLQVCQLPLSQGAHTCWY